MRLTGLHVEECADLVREVRPLYPAAESARLSRPDRQRACGGGDRPNRSGRDPILWPVIGLRLYPTPDGLGYFFGLSPARVSR